MRPSPHRRAILGSGLLLVAEVALALATVVSLFGWPGTARARDLGLACLAAVILFWGGLAAWFLLGLRRAANGPGASVALQRRTALHAGLACLGALVGAAVYATLVGRLPRQPPLDALSLIAGVGSSVLLVECLRPAALGRLLSPGRGVDADVPPAATEPTPRFSLVVAGLATGAAGICAVALFVHFFVPLPTVHRRILVAYFPFTGLLVAGVWLAAAVRLARPVERYHRLALGAPAAAQAFRAAQILPYTLAGLKVLAFGVGAILLYLEAVALFGVDHEYATYMAGATVLAGCAAGLYEAFWHRTSLRPLLARIAAGHRIDPVAVRSPLSLRVKMFGGFGLVLFFTCAIAIFWSLVQARTLAVAFLQKQARLKADAVADRLRTQEKIGDPVEAADVTGLLARLSGTGEEVFWYLPAAGPPEQFAAPGQSCPPLPFVARTRMRRQPSGVLRLGDIGYVGAFLRLRLGGRDLGSVAVLYPDQTREAEVRGPRFAVLAAFFLVLLGICTGIVALIVADLTAPLRTLEQRAGEMARGALDRPVVTGAEADEVGRLAFVLDDMRRSLAEQIRTIAELNVGLEAKVATRTADLAQANEDLKQAIASLTRAQDQLVRSEKLASIGQLVAGIAHELNNPVNAVSNCVEPLQATLGRVLAAGPDGARDGGRPALEEDLRAMLRVIRNGTERIQRIVSALSSYSRTDAEEDAPVDLHGLLEETLEIAAHLLQGVRVIREYAPRAEVLGHRGELGQVFMNLVANAAHAMADRPDPWIRITTRSGGEAVEVTVADHGPGVPPELRARIFDPFFTTKAVGQGTGLGLSISHEIVRRHRGRLEVGEAPGGGAAFTVVLPVATSGATPRREG